MTPSNTIASSQPAPPKSIIRTDIQALRAIAVLLVILDHLVLIQKLPGHPLGGFIGVDVFFVISGFLITQHLAKEVSSTGRVSFRDFYRRRARRILPMALLVIAATLVASWLVFWPWQTASSAKDGLWAALFVSNIAFALRGVDYFAADHVSVFQHYWSLSVEEQFYLVWPVLIAAAALGGTRSRTLQRRLFWIALSVGSASLVWACLETRSSPTEAYFSTLARGFQFAVGAIVALITPRLAGLNHSLRPWLSGFGLAVIIASVWLVDPSAGFPGPMGLLPALGAGLFIASGTGTAHQVALWPLRTKPMTYVGDISYSLYLWHWPVIVFLSALIPRSIVVVPATLILTGVLSIISYRFIEQGVLRSTWLLPGGQAHRSKGVVGLQPHGRDSLVRNAGVMISTIVLVGAAVAVGDAAVRRMSSSRTASTPAGALQLQPQPAPALKHIEEIQGLITASDARSDWTGLKPSISDISTYGTELTKECWTSQRDTPRSCVRGNPQAAHTIVVLGDSIAMNAAFSVDAFVQQNPEWKMIVYAKLGCAFASIDQPAPDGSAYPECTAFRKWAIARIQQDRPDVVWTTSAIPSRTPSASEAQLQGIWKHGMEETLIQLSAVPRILIVAPPPPGRDLVFCSRPFNQPSDCAGSISDRWLHINAASRDAAEAAGRTYIDTGLWYCNRNGYCPAVIGDYIVRRDERHLTYEYGRFLAPLVKAWVEATPGGR